MRIVSMRKRLLALIRRHPDWSNVQLADHLNQKVDTIRGAKSALRRAGLLAPYVRPVAEPGPMKPKIRKKIVKAAQRSVPPQSMGSGRGYSFGQESYLRLL